MAALFLIGNVKQFTFANAALAAHVRERDCGRVGLTDVFVLHSPGSQAALSRLDDWQQHLRSNGLDPEIFFSVTVDLRDESDDQISLVARRIEQFLSGLSDQDEVYVDLTNGTSRYKSILACIAYILGVRRQFILEVESGQQERFLSPADLRLVYHELPDPSVLDSVGAAWLTEMRRFKPNIVRAADTLSAIRGTKKVEQIGFEQDAQSAVASWFRGAKHGNVAALSGAVRHVGRAFEELIVSVYEAVTRDTGRSKRLHQMLAEISLHLNGTAPTYEPQLLDDVSDLLRRWRNSAVHDPPSSVAFGKIRARISTELLLASTEYLAVLHEKGLLAPDGGTQTPALHYSYTTDAKDGETYYFGLDGDDTGRELERMFQENSAAMAFSKFSRAVDKAIRAVAKKVELNPINGKIIFSSGDDILFEGCYHTHAIAELQSTYRDVSGGHTCSIGFGKSPRDAYVALKMAKARPGKNAIMGMELVSAP